MTFHGEINQKKWHILEFLDSHDSDGRQNQWFCLSADLNKFQCFGRDQGGGYQASRYGELTVSISKWNVITRILWNIGRPILQCKGENRQC